MDEIKPQWLILVEEKEVVVGLLHEDRSFHISKPREWGGESKEDLLAELDTGLGECLSASSRESKPEDAVFILSPFWIDNEGKVAETRKQLLKEICEHLSFSPSGFLVADEVLAFYYKDCVSIYFGQDYFRISLLQDGKVVARKEIENGMAVREEELTAEIEKLKIDKPLPGKLILWGKTEEKLEGKLQGVEKIIWDDIFGYFVRLVTKGKEKVASELEKIEEEEEKASQPAEEFSETSTTEDDFGFTEKDVAEVESNQESNVGKEKSSIEESITEVQKPEEVNIEYLEEKPKKKLKFRFKLPSFPLSLPLKFSNFSKWLVFIPPLLIILFLLSWFFSKATVELYITPETVSAESEVKLDPSIKEFDLENWLVPAKKVEVVLSGEKTEVTTGEKITGEKAKGEVTIYNRTANSQTFDSGTMLLGPGGLKFLIDEEIKVASKTPDLVSGVDRWGEIKASVTAEKFGAGYNLAAESVFTIEKLSKNDFLAKNQTALSGGTSRQVRAVSKEDMDKLEKILSDDLSTEVKEKLKSQSSSSQDQLIIESLTSEVVEKSFDSNIGDEKDELSLSLKTKFSAINLDYQQLVKLGNDVLGKEVDKASLSLGKTKAEFSFKEVKENLVVGKIAFTGSLEPKIDLKQIIKDLTGKSKNKARELIKTYPRIYRYQIISSPSILKFLPLLPPQTKNIKIELRD